MSRPRAIGRRALLIGPALALLAGCGFRPVYGNRGAGGGALSSVAVAVMTDRMGQLLHNELLRRLQPTEHTTHEIQATVSLVDQSLGILSSDEATLGNLIAVASWTLLTRTGEGRMRLDKKGTVRAAVTYNIVDNQYATEQNRRKAQMDMAETLASDIEARLTAFFAAPRRR